MVNQFIIESRPAVTFSDSEKVPTIASWLQTGPSSSSTDSPVVYCSIISNSKFSSTVALVHDLTLMLRVDFLFKHRYESHFKY